MPREQGPLIMKVSAGVKPALWGAAGGAIAWWVVLSAVLGWTSPGTAQKLAAKQSENAVISVLAPICANKFLAQPDAAVKKAALAKVDSWKRRDAFPEEWVTLPGGRSTDSDLIDACSALVLKAS